MSIGIFKNTVAVLLLITFSFGCKDRNSTAVPSNRGGEPNRPLVFMYQTPTYPASGAKLVYGICFAVWSNGNVVVADGPPGEQYIRGKISPADLERLLQEVYSLHGKRSSEIVVPLDSGTLRLCWLEDGKLMYVVETLTVPLSTSSRLATIEQMVKGMSLSNTETYQSTGVVPQEWLRDPVERDGQ